MKPLWETPISQLDNALLSWETNFPALPSSFVYQTQNIPIAEFNSSFVEIVGLVKAIGSSDDIDAMLLAVHQPNVINICSQILQTVSNLSSNPNAYLEQLVNLIWSLRSSLAWLTPDSFKENFKNRLNDFEAIGKLEATERLYLQLQESISKVNSVVGQTTSANTNIQEILTKITGYEREASNAKINAESSSQSATSNKDNVYSLLNDLKEGMEQYKNLLGSTNDLKDKAELVLEGTSKAGLAASFGARRTQLEKAQANWSLAFGTGIILIITGVVVSTINVINFPPLIKTNGFIDPWGVLARLMLTGPAIWFTWFAAKQYGHTLRLIEDYAFKEAAALAFIGYRREMGDDDEMLQLLRETAIKNFGASPTRLLAKNDIASPIHELLDKALDGKVNPDRLVEMLKVMKPNGKT